MRKRDIVVISAIFVAVTLGIILNVDSFVVTMDVLLGGW